MVTTPSKSITLKEFLALPETKPALEYIDGKIIPKPMPKGKHSVIQGELIIALNSVLKPQKTARAFSELRCTFGGRSTVPDVTVFIWDRIPRDENGEIADMFQAAPDWTIEILSPAQSQTRVTKNILHCLDYGSQLGWLIDPQEQSVLVYFQGQQPAFFEAETDVLPVPDFAQAFELTLGELFGWLME
jgi:Uma2 family endonuclease